MPLLSTIGAAAARAFGFLRSLISGYNVANSLRFNSASSDYLSRTQSSTGNRQKFTISMWAKRSRTSTNDFFLWSSSDGTTNYSSLLFSADAFRYYDYGGSLTNDLLTTQLFRDVSAWYHVIVAVDTTQATSSNRFKMYVNGSQITSFATATYPSLNYNTFANLSGYGTQVGLQINGTYYNGYLSEVYLIDGQQLDASSFGETDTDTGIWKPKAYTGSYGTNGFYLKFANSASLGTDSSGNGNTFTVNNLTSVDQSTDTPTNNFATGNSLDVNGITFTEGNLLAASTGATWKSARGTIGMSQGKWFWEMKATASASSFDGQVGVGLFSLAIASFAEWTTANPSVVYSAGDGLKWVNGVSSAYGASWTVGDIIGVAFDADNLTVTFYKNGVSQGTITPGWSANTYASEIAFYGRAGGTTSGSFNFGSPPYSANSYTDGAGYGNFSYAVPSGYYALNTKNLANFG
jgi:hypothetical protein